jgi:hypothetical protein
MLPIFSLNPITNDQLSTAAYFTYCVSILGKIHIVIYMDIKGIKALSRFFKILSFVYCTDQN